MAGAITDAELVSRCRSGDQAAWNELVERVQRLVQAAGLEIVELGRPLPPRAAEAVDAKPACQLRDPRADRVVRPKPVEALVDAGEDLLEDVLRVVR